MRLSLASFAASAATAAVAVFCGFRAQVTGDVDVPVIVTAALAYDPTAALRGQERFPRGAQLLVVKNGKSELLVDGFAATADADVSFDANRVLFAGKKRVDEAWAIWEITLADRSVRSVMLGDADLIRPLYLPDDRLVFAQRTAAGFQLATAKLDGTERAKLTHIPSNAVPADVLADGRILFDSTYPLGAGTTLEMYLVYSDGSGVESYRCDHGSARWGGSQLASGDVIFTHGGTLARFTSPLAAETPVDAPKAEYTGAVLEVGNRGWLFSARESGERHTSLKLWKQGASAFRPFFARSGEDLVEPSLVAERTRPHRHPSGLHEWNHGDLLALNARESREGDLKSSPATVRIDKLDSEGKTAVVGTAPVEADGSFFVKAPADTPLRFALLDANGHVLRQENGWFWIRKGEQRVCVACHTGPERAPENRVPAVLLQTTVPVDLTGSGTPAVAGSH